MLVVQKVGIFLMDNPNMGTFLATVMLTVVTGFLVWVTLLLRRTTALQYVSSLAVAFQDEWHSTRAILMREYLHSEEFTKVFEDAIKDAYGNNIDYRRENDHGRNVGIGDLLKRENLTSSNANQGQLTDDDRLKKFHQRLQKSIYFDPVNPTVPLFTAYQALYEVLLSFDRLAVLQDAPGTERFIVKFRPPVRDLALVLQAFVAVRLLLREKGSKNYKKDYMLLLYSLDLESDALFSLCKEGLKAEPRKEWSNEEEKRARKIRQRYLSNHCKRACC